MLKDFPLEISQRLICLVGSMGMRVVMQEQHAFGEESWLLPLNGLTKFPSNFHLFGPLKHHLSAEHFPNDETVEREVAAWFRQQPKEFYPASFQGLVKQWDTCLNVQ
jgi:hypothetical protein